MLKNKRSINLKVTNGKKVANQVVNQHRQLELKQQKPIQIKSVNRKLDKTVVQYALGVLIKIGQARYKSFARPGDLLVVTIELTDHFAGVFDFSGSIKVGSKIIMRNSFQLTNVKSTLLQGN